MADVSTAVIGTPIKLPAEFTSGFRIYKVTAVTQTRIKCGTIEMRKFDGLVFGSGVGWKRRYASIATDKDLLLHRIAVAKSRLAQIVVTPDNLLEVEALIGGTQ